MLDMFSRPAGLRNVTLQKGEVATGRELLCPPIWWEELVWAALESVCRAARPGSLVTASLNSGEGRIDLDLGGELEHDPEPLPERLLQRLGAECRVDGNCMKLELPLGRQT